MTDPKRGRWRIAVQVIAVAMLIDVTVSPAICPAQQRPVTPAPGVAPAASAPQGPATLTVNPAPGSRDVDPSTPIVVTASTGVLVAVQMVNETRQGHRWCPDTGSEGVEARRASGVRPHLHAHHHRSRHRYDYNDLDYKLFHRDAR